MNIAKLTIATAAVITCCLGNEMPAQAMNPVNQMLNSAQVQFNAGNENLGCVFVNNALIIDNQRPSGDPNTINKLYSFASRCKLSIY